MIVGYSVQYVYLYGASPSITNFDRVKVGNIIPVEIGYGEYKIGRVGFSDRGADFQRARLIIGRRSGCVPLGFQFRYCEP